MWSSTLRKLMLPRFIRASPAPRWVITSIRTPSFNLTSQRFSVFPIALMLFGCSYEKVASHTGE